MGRRPLQSQPLSQAQINDILLSNPQAKARPAIVLKTAPTDPETYDPLHLEETVKAFLHAWKSAPQMYEEAKAIVGLCDKQTQDLLHYMELSENQNAPKGYALYRKLAEVRRLRRTCKNEVEQLEPLIALIDSVRTPFEDQLAQLQGRCRGTREAIEKRMYGVQTDILDDFVKEGNDDKL